MKNKGSLSPTSTMSPFPYDLLYHYSEKFTRDPDHRQDLVLMAWQQDKRILLIRTDKATACSTFEMDGGANLIGTNLLACHPEPARTKVSVLLESGVPNVYTIEKAGVKKLIFQSPWYENGKYAGFVELSLPIPEQMPHFVRDARPDQ